jgi:phosphatidylglycerol:prolipoprotein diacylglycerol transferase
MMNEWLHVDGLVITPFGVLLATAFAAAYFQLRWGLKKTSAGNADDASALTVAAALGGVIGAKLYYAILYGDWRLVFSTAGLVWYGGFLLGAAAFLWTLHRRKLPRWKCLDAASLSLVLGYAIGRVGCFLVGDDYGIPTNLPWGVAYPHGLPPTTAGSLREHFHAVLPHGVPDTALIRVHPTQLYETALALGIFALGRRLLSKNLEPGATFLLVIALLAIERFAIEFLRLKDDRFFGPVTLAQLLSLAVVAGCLFLWRRHRRSS